MMIGSRIALSVLCAAALLLTPASLPTTPAALAQVTQGNQGLQGGWAVDDTGKINFAHSLSQQYSIMKEVGAGWVRVNFRLGSCFQDWTTQTRCAGTDGPTALVVYDQVVQNALSNNLKVVGLISNESWRGSQVQWTANNAENAGANTRRTGDNTYIRDFASKAVTTLAKRYAGKINHWEIWNEPNAYTGLDAAGNPTGGSFIYPSNFAWMLKRSHQAVKSAQAGTVIAGGLLSHDPTGATATIVEDGVRKRVTRRGTVRGTSLERRARPAGRGPEPEVDPAAEATATVGCEMIPSGADYLCSTYDMGIAKAGWTTYKSQNGTYPLDHVGQHLYVDQGGPTTTSKLTAHLQEVRNAYLRSEGSGSTKKIHVTEVGWETTTGYTTPDVQAGNLRVAFADTFNATPYIGRAFWFNVQDVPEDGLDGLWYGLVAGDYDARSPNPALRKPSFPAYQEYAR